MRHFSLLGLTILIMLVINCADWCQCSIQKTYSEIYTAKGVVTARWGNTIHPRVIIECRDRNINFNIIDRWHLREGQIVTVFYKEAYRVHIRDGVIGKKEFVAYCVETIKKD